MKRLSAVLLILAAFLATNVHAVGSDKALTPKSGFSQRKETRPCSYVSKNSLACSEATLNNDGGLDDSWAISDLADQIRDKAEEHLCSIKARKEGRAVNSGVKVKYYENLLRLEIVAENGCD